MTPPECPDCGNTMKVSSGSYTSYICNRCEGIFSGLRWFCECRNDYCFSCYARKESPPPTTYFILFLVTIPSFFRKESPPPTTLDKESIGQNAALGSLCAILYSIFSNNSLFFRPECCPGQPLRDLESGGASFPP